MLITHILTQKLRLVCLVGGSSSSSLLQFWSLLVLEASPFWVLSLVIAVAALTHEDASKYVSFFLGFFYFLLLKFELVLSAKIEIPKP